MKGDLGTVHQKLFLYTLNNAHFTSKSILSIFPGKLIFLKFQSYISKLSLKKLKILSHAERVGKISCRVREVSIVYHQWHGAFCTPKRRWDPHLLSFNSQWLKTLNLVRYRGWRSWFLSHFDIRNTSLALVRTISRSVSFRIVPYCHKYFKSITAQRGILVKHAWKIKISVCDCARYDMPSRIVLPHRASLK